MDNIQQVVNQNSDQAPVVDPQQQVTPISEEVATPAPGDKTESALLLKSLQEEREKRRQLEEKLAQAEELTSSTPLSEDQSDEGKAILAEVRALKTELAEVKQSSAKSELQSSNPIFKEKWSEFETFRTDPENKGMHLKTAAKAFLIEAGMYEAPRRGLEKVTGGLRQPLSNALTADDAKHLRETNPRKWKELVTKGALKFE